MLCSLLEGAAGQAEPAGAPGQQGNELMIIGGHLGTTEETMDAY